MFEKKKYPSGRNKSLRILFPVFVFILLAAVLSGVVMLLWNYILTDVTGVKPVKYWQAAGILLLARILFGGFGRSGKKWGRHSRRHSWRKRWMQMSQEEREEAKSRWKEHCKKRNTPHPEE